MCNNCIHKAVCGKFAATGGHVRECEHFKEERKGEWINWGKSGTPTYENYGTCSVCHEDAEICTGHRNYCPNCGAKMDGDGND